MAKGKKIKKGLRVLLYFFIFFIVLSVIPVFLYRIISPPITPLMFLRSLDMKIESDPVVMNYKWVSLDEMSPNLFKAALAAEDDKFLEHTGFDFRAIKLAYQSNQKSTKRVKGGSTISQQTAKNVFLWPHRDYLRKGLEAWFTLLIEACWGKERIMETYLNIVELGDGIYGVEVASLKYFKKHASKLNAYEAASLIAVLPNPHIYKVKDPSDYTLRYRKRFYFLNRKTKLIKS
jgi:monofunctional biosynthetic peptidoglycan transglycosylase